MINEGGSIWLDISKLQKNSKQTQKIKRGIVDLIKYGIDVDVKVHLLLGPNFSEAPTKVPYEQVIFSTEQGCDNIRKEAKDVQSKKAEDEKEIVLLTDKVKRMLENAKDRRLF